MKAKTLKDLIEGRIRPSAQHLSELGRNFNLKLHLPKGAKLTFDKQCIFYSVVKGVTMDGDKSKSGSEYPQCEIAVTITLPEGEVKHRFMSLSEFKYLPKGGLDWLRDQKDANTSISLYEADNIEELESLIGGKTLILTHRTEVQEYQGRKVDDGTYRTYRSHFNIYDFE